MNQFVSYQGIEGAYSHLACLHVTPDFTPMPCKDFRAAVKAVQDGFADRAVLPTDNIIAGRVAAIHDLLPGTGLHIINEYNLVINHRLMVPKGGKLSDIKKVLSHMHALPQCSHFIDQFGWEKVTVGDTATAAKNVYDWNDPTIAAIASPEAAEIHGLHIVADDIANKIYNKQGDLVENFTRFVAMARQPIVERTQEDKNKPYKSSAVIGISGTKHSDLMHVLSKFACNGVNISKIESYHNYQNKLEKMYFEFDDYLFSDPMQQAFNEFKKEGRDVEQLGTYPAAKALNI